jgi:protein-tyrosine phosphatase
LPNPARFLEFPSLLNARDLGGYPTLDGAETRWRSLLRADDLVQLTPAGVRAMSDYGIETVIDLRWPEEVAASPNPVPTHLKHVRYHQVSLLARSEVEWLSTRTECTKEMWKCSVLEHARSELKRVLQIIARAAPGPLLFHCMAGKDRTGVIAALLLALADTTPDAIAHDYATSTTRLRDAYLKRYAQQGPERVLEDVRCPEAGIHNLLAYLERLGGIRPYLELIGLEGEEIARLRARLR